MNIVRTNESFNDNKYNEGESFSLSHTEEFYRVITGFWPFLRIRESILFLMHPPSPFPEIRGSSLLSLIISVSLFWSGNETVLAIKRIQRKDLASCSKLLWNTCFRRRFDLQLILCHSSHSPSTRNKKFRSLEFLSGSVLAVVLKHCSACLYIASGLLFNGNFLIHAR